MNALAHMCIGFDSEIGKEPLRLTNMMTIGTFTEQLERTKQTKEAELIYYGIVLFGDWAKVYELTRKFSLWK